MATNDQPIESSAVTYEALRKAGRALIPKLYRTTAGRLYDVMKAGKQLTLPIVDRTFVFESETDMNALADFWIHEFRQGGRTMIERVGPEELNLNPIEAIVLRAHQQTRTSLFAAIAADPGLHQVRLRDVLEPEQPEVCLSDFGLSESLARLGVRRLLFLRLVSASGFQMTSGVSFVFPAERQAELVRAFHERMKTVPPADRAARKYIFFYRRHRECGEMQLYHEAPGTV